MESLPMLLVYAVGLIVALWFFVVLPYRMAERRGRRGWIYVLLSFLLTPVLVVTVLWVLGRARTG